MQKYYLAMVQAFVSFLAICLLSSIKMSYIIGSYFSFFSAANIMLPLTGLSGGAMAVFAIVLFRIAKMIAIGNINPWSFLVHGLPGIGAALYFVPAYAFIMRLLIPAACILLFIAHPVGFQAAAYTLFWFIPMVIYFSKTNYLFFHALSSTFVAHAVGSVIWLYTVPMAAAVWLDLIPLVLVERTVYALGMVLVYTIVAKTVALYNVVAQKMSCTSRSIFIAQK
jgi:hypothetical protein